MFQHSLYTSYGLVAQHERTNQLTFPGTRPSMKVGRYVDIALLKDLEKPRLRLLESIHTSYRRNKNCQKSPRN